MRNLQTVNKIISRELGIKEDVVEMVNAFYWKEVRKKLSTLESTSVSIKHLGTITTSKRKIDQFIRISITKIRKIRKSTRYKESTKALLLDVTFDKLRKALVQRNELAIQYYEAYMERSQRVHNTSADNSESISEDSRGDNERSEGTLEHTP